MKAFPCLAIGVFILCIVPFICQAQDNTSQTLPATIPEPTPYTITTQDANSRVWERTVYELDPSGQVLPRKHSYTELATGLNFKKNGQWVESKEQIDILPNGTAVATNGQHQVIFPGDIYQGQIEMVTPDGKHLKSRPLMLSYFDGTNTVAIAALTNSIGVVVGSNQVVYANAFTDFKVDLRYTYTKAGFEQDIILRQQPPTPESLGLNPDTARLQVMTEFFSPPQPTIQNFRMPVQAGLALADQSLNFGAMQMVPGRAFLMGQNANEAGALVSKHWVSVQGRQFLVEEVPVDAILEGLAGLPLTAMNSSSSKNAHTASKQLKLPPQRLVQNESKGMLIAKTDLPAQGFVLDYQALHTGQNNYTFRGDTTYYIYGNVPLTGSNIFEGGAVIKFAHTSISSSAPLVFKTGPYRPVIFTAVDDNSVGETISGSTGNPIGYYATTALSLSSIATQAISGLRISYAQTAIAVANMPLTLTNIQIKNCSIGLAATGGKTNVINNALFSNVATNFSLTGSDQTVVKANNVTFNNAKYLFNTYNAGVGGVTSSGIGTLSSSAFLSSSPSPPSGPSVYLYLTNCVLANITNVSGVTSASYNGFYQTTSFGYPQVTSSAYPFQVAGAGSFYLTNGCYFFNQGTTNIDPVLLSILQQKTTYPPLIYSNFSISVATNFSPQVQRDTDTPDLGYHYDPIDYLVDNLVLTNSTLAVTNGVAIASYNEPGIQLQTGSAILSTGTPLSPNWFTRYQSVQEQSIALGGTNVNTGQTVSSPGGAAAVFQFSKFTCPAFGGYHLYDAAASTYTNLAVKHCEFYGGQNFLTGTNNSTATLVNNLFYRSSLTATATNLTSVLAFTNNLVFGTTVYLLQPTNSIWSAFNNDFDSCTITNSTLTNGYDAYLNSTGRLYPTNVNDVVQTATLSYQTGPLGGFYQLTSSPLINMGSTTADQVGLYHYTVTTNLVSGLEIKETNSIVDIGYHYVAVDANGNPIDTDGDGIPDYLEDSNGNGIFDAEDLGNWLIGSFNGLSNGNGLSVFTPLK